MNTIYLYGYFGAYNPHHYYFFKDKNFILELGKYNYSLKVCEQPELDISQIDRDDWVIFLESTSVGKRYGYKRKTIGLIRKILQRPNKIERESLYDKLMKKGFKSSMILLIHECVANIPDNYNKYLHDMFDIILINNDNYIDNKKYYLWRFPVPLESPMVENIPFSERKLLICSLTNNYSGNKEHLGKFRRDEIGYYCKRWPSDFDLYGCNWNVPVTKVQKVFPFFVPKFECYRGYLDEIDKPKTFSKYKFNLCYENCAVQPGWVSNRLFDSLRSCCVPIFYGATNIKEIVDDDAFIDRRDFKSAKELGDYIEFMSQNEFLRYQKAMANFLSSDRFKTFLITSFAEKIISVIESVKKTRPV